MGLRHHVHVLKNISTVHHAGHYVRTLHVFVEMQCQDTSPIASTCNMTYIYSMYSNMKIYQLHITQATMCAPWATLAISNAKVKLFWSSTTCAFASSRRRSTDAYPRSAQMESGMFQKRKPPKGSIFCWILILASTSFLHFFNVECDVLEEEAAKRVIFWSSVFLCICLHVPRFCVFFMANMISWKGGCQECQFFLFVFSCIYIRLPDFFWFSISSWMFAKRSHRGGFLLYLRGKHIICLVFLHWSLNLCDDW